MIEKANFDYASTVFGESALNGEIKADQPCKPWNIKLLIFLFINISL